MRNQPLINWGKVLRVNVLGGLCVMRDGRALTGSTVQPRRLALLARLARAGEPGVTREKLLSTLWPDADEERGRRALNQTLYAIRRDLGADDVIVGLKDLRLNSELLTSDVAEMSDALASGEIERGMSLYGGPFLDGFHLPGIDEFERWADAERATLAREHALELVDGALYRRADGTLRLDLRRTDLASGGVRGAYTVTGADVFALADSGTAQLVVGLGVTAPAGSVADVTTRSIVAYRMYERGLRAYFRGDGRGAAGFFDAATTEDTSFAMAAYYSAIVPPVGSTVDDQMARLARAERLAGHAIDRERLTIRAGWANAVSSPIMRATAETLAVRYPTEVEGQLYWGMALLNEGEFLAALPHLRRVVTMDSLGLRGAGARCGGCDALQSIVSAYAHLDSLEAGEREARRWRALQPTSTRALDALAEMLLFRGREDEALEVFRSTQPVDGARDDALSFATERYMRKGEFERADRIFRDQIQNATPPRKAAAHWNLSLSLRHLYVTRTEIHELLGHAWEAAGGRDSATAHYRVVAASWQRADPSFQPRVDRVRARLTALAGPG